MQGAGNYYAQIRSVCGLQYRLQVELPPPTALGNLEGAHLGRRLVTELSAWIMIDPVLNPLDIPCRKLANIRSFGHKSSDQLILVLVASPFPRAVGVRTIDVRALFEQSGWSAPSALFKNSLPLSTVMVLKISEKREP